MASNNAAKSLKALHVPTKPVVFANVWDVSSFNTVVSVNEGDNKPVKAIATASWAIAATHGLQDEELSADQNLEAIGRIAALANKAGLPLSADLQDGYGSRIVEVVTAAVKSGISGANIEDSIPSAGFGKGISGSLYALDDQVKRLKSALKAAADAGCPDFALNARCDVYCLDDPNLDDDTRLKEAITRGKAFLELGATTVFYWGGKLTKEHLQTLVKELDGRVAVLFSAYPGVKSTSELAELGVARVSIGPGLYRIAMQAVKAAATNYLGGGNLAP